MLAPAVPPGAGHHPKQGSVAGTMAAGRVPQFSQLRQGRSKHETRPQVQAQLCILCPVIPAASAMGILAERKLLKEVAGIQASAFTPGSVLSTYASRNWPAAGNRHHRGNLRRSGKPEGLVQPGAPFRHLRLQPSSGLALGFMIPYVSTEPPGGSARCAAIPHPDSIHARCRWRRVELGLRPP